MSAKAEVEAEASTKEPLSAAASQNGDIALLSISLGRLMYSCSIDGRKQRFGIG
ncbi:MAG: hypothetical protein J0M35_06150 [Candidatus Obscuribacter phosphatis]|uniref:Uncharacterized protein n=1 Tax=Candidatus Obscuribacter phosphatis TaxID=1906157 RepID=A0A8J7PHS0_9BACT|nr:hypothetical protein [Candidatus Obscuribacter phosphatis]